MTGPSKRRVGHRALWWPGWLALLLALAGCITPTLPPDDPPEPEVELGAGVARLRGHVGRGPSFVFVHNRVSGLVFGEQTPTGAYDFEVLTAPCDLLSLWYTMGAFQSSAITFRPAEIVGRRGECSDEEPASDVDAGPSESEP
jgi:hypothetical protein